MLVKARIALLLILCTLASSENTIQLAINKRIKKLNHYLKRKNIYQTQLFNNDGSEYLINIGVGTPVQNFIVSLDTGSSDLWIPSTQCPTQDCPHSKFDASKSSTFRAVDNTQPFYIEYGIGSVNGSYARDSVHLGGAHIAQQLFGLATSTRDIILPYSSPSNGIFGLGYPALTTGNKNYQPFVFQLAERGLIEKPVFSISMGSMIETGWSGEILLGGINQDKYVGKLVYEPVLSGESGNTTYWMVGSDSIQVRRDHTRDQNLVYSNTFSHARGLIIDTGTTLTYMDHEMAEAIVHRVAYGSVLFDSKSGVYIVDCRTGVDPSRSYSVHFTLSQSQTKLSIPVRDLVLPIGDGLCMFGIAPWMNTGNSAKMKEKGWILVGDSVLRSSYLVFDMKQHQIGFAKVCASKMSINHLSYMQ
ncbi:Gastricsin [Choanephora cucurbitarum]|uniref:Gastricsin n=1 Tax=Choanephora cucurbitarum TaxID=101091 RepID=A0A1C7N617_9FUNG|nr:Gastricsin [Choanephora cucurbitarum]